MGATYGIGYIVSTIRSNATVEKFGKLDAFFANAGIMPNACFKDHKAAVDKWDQCIDINLKGNFYGICASYYQFKAQGWGHFLTTSSIHGNFPTSGAGVYSATKIASRYLAKSLAMENHGMIKTTVINPPGVTTTELFGTVVCQEGTDGILGSNFPVLMNALDKIQSGEDISYADPDSIHYITLNTDDMVRSIVYALNQPRGMSIAEVTMYPSNNIYLI